MEHDEPADSERHMFLADLPARLGGAVGGDELRAALGVELPGVARRVEPHVMWVGGRRLRSSLPRVVLDLEPPVDARWVCEQWRIDAPVAVSGDVHQQRWHLQVAGRELPDPTHRRIASTPPTAGRWEIDVVLSDRPSGPLPGVVSGASPAYDVLIVGGEVASLSIERTWVATDVVGSDHPALTALTALAPLDPPLRAGRRWRGRRGTPSEHVVVRVDDAPLVAAGFHVDRGALWAHSFSTTLRAPTSHAGSALIDALEAIALAEGVDLVRLDRSVVEIQAVVPFERHGYHRIGTAGDATTTSPGDDGSIEVFAERRLDVPT
jgi:hypothetical protein